MGTKLVVWGAEVSTVVIEVNSDRNWLSSVLGQRLSYDFASLYALFNISSAPGPIISDSKDAVVFRICETWMSDVK